jgi:hypothetical protein
MHKVCQAREPQENTIPRKGRKTTPAEKTSANTMRFNGFREKDGESEACFIKTTSEILLSFETGCEFLRTSLS